MGSYDYLLGARNSAFRLGRLCELGAPLVIIEHELKILVRLVAKLKNDPRLPGSKKYRREIGRKFKPITTP